MQNLLGKGNFGEVCGWRGRTVNAHCIRYAVNHTHRGVSQPVKGMRVLARPSRLVSNP